MPTFKLDDLDDSITYGGDDDMYFRQWRVPSMKPVLDKKLDRDFQAAIGKKDDFFQKRAESKKKHDEKLDRRMKELERQMSNAKVSETKENRHVFRKPTDQEMKLWKDNLDREFESPSSTAPMKQANQLAARLKPRSTPLFGASMTGLKNIVLPPPTTSSTQSVFGSLPRKPLVSESSTGTSTPKDNSFLNNSHETVFYPQNHSSFNLDHYNGTRPSFAFAGLNAATSTPVSKNPMKFPFGAEKITEEGDDTVFEDTKYVTAMESPIQKPSALAEEIEKKKAREEAEKQKVREEQLRKQKAKGEELLKQKVLEEKIRKQKIKEEEIRKQKAKEEEIRKQKAKEEELLKQNALEKELRKQQAKEEEIRKQKAKEEEIRKQRTEEENLQKAIAAQRARQEKIITEEDAYRKALLAKAKNELDLQKRQLEEAKQRITEKPVEIPAPAQKSVFTRPYILFKNYIELMATLLKEKSDYEKSADGQSRALLKRTITEKVTVFTQRHTTSTMRQEILDFFKNLLLKQEVKGFTIEATAPPLRLKETADVNYAVYCIVEKYMSLAERDDELATTISDLISRLSLHVRRIEKVFIVMMFNKSILLRQNPDECRIHFVETELESDEKAIVVNRESALVTLFLHVFVKNALISTKGRKMVLDEPLMWKFAESVVAHAPEVPKASMVVLLLITSCKPGLCTDAKRWDSLLEKIEYETIPLLENEPFPGDESVISKLKQIMTVLRR